MEQKIIIGLGAVMINELLNEIVNLYFEGHSLDEIFSNLRNNLREEDLEEIKKIILINEMEKE